MSRKTLLAVACVAIAIALWYGASQAAITTSPVGSNPQVVGIDATGGQITLDISSGYTVWHTGKTTSGDVSDAVIVFGFANQATAADYSAEADKLILAPNSSVKLLKGAGSVYAKSSSGTVSVQFLPL